MTIDERYASRKFVLAYALITVSLILIVLLDKDQFGLFSNYSLQIFGMYVIANVATKVVTK